MKACEDGSTTEGCEIVLVGSTDPLDSAVDAEALDEPGDLSGVEGEPATEAFLAMLSAFSRIWSRSVHHPTMSPGGETGTRPGTEKIHA